MRDRSDCDSRATLFYLLFFSDILPLNIRQSVRCRTTRGYEWKIVQDPAPSSLHVPSFFSSDARNRLLRTVHYWRQTFRLGTGVIFPFCVMMGRFTHMRTCRLSHVHTLTHTKVHAMYTLLQHLLLLFTRTCTRIEWYKSYIIHNCTICTYTTY